MMKASTLKAIRATHNYSGVFLAPAILFFAITGGLQMFGLHETSKGSSYVPPALLTHLSQLHKKGTLYFPPKGPGPSGGLTKAEGPGKPEGAKPVGSASGVAAAVSVAPAGAPPNPLPIKIFFGLTAVGLVVSTFTGVVMAWKYARRKRLVAATLVAGVVVPLLLLLV